MTTERRVAATNTTETYGWVERAFHWAIALLIPTAIVLGVIAHGLGEGVDSDAAVARVALLFSLHKSVGLAILFVALARIAWALSQPRPRPLHPERRAETFLAALVHWLLYGSLVLVPMLGWATHATSEGFAPIPWPFGQSLPFLPKDPALSETFATLHMVFERVMVGALILHVVGTLKHVFVDRDATLGRMWRGADPGPLKAAPSHLAAPGAAVVIWLAALTGGVMLAPAEDPAASVAATEATAARNWEVEDGTVAITVQQLGSPVEGAFEQWSAAIDFDEELRADGSHGNVEAIISTGSLRLGSVSDQATGPDFLAAGQFPDARFEATILPGEDGGYVADGTLAIREAELPAQLPFTLSIEDGVAQMEGALTIDRRNFGIGEKYADESNVGFSVAVGISLTARASE